MTIPTTFRRCTGGATGTKDRAEFELSKPGGSDAELEELGLTDSFQEF
jgi:hypothetical protein